jgi:transposase
MARPKALTLLQAARVRAVHRRRRQSVPEIAERFGVSRSTVRKAILKIAPYDKPPRRRKPKEIDHGQNRI